MNWKIENSNGRYRLYMEGFYPLPDHAYQIWWPVRNTETDYWFDSLADVMERIDQGACLPLISARKKYMEVQSD